MEEKDETHTLYPSQTLDSDVGDDGGEVQEGILPRGKLSVGGEISVLYSSRDLGWDTG